jgi:hypothetical protein
MKEPQIVSLVLAPQALGMCFPFLSLFAALSFLPNKIFSHLLKKNK